MITVPFTKRVVWGILFNMKTDLFFYIVVVSYRAGEKLVQTVSRVLEQRGTAFRVIVQDGASDDGSVEILRSACGGDSRLTIRTEPDGGIYDAMNRALEAAAADAFRRGLRQNDAYVLFLNCGDYLADDAVLRQAAKRISAVRNRMAMRAQVAPSSFAPDICYGDTHDRRTGQTVTAAPKIDDFAAYRHLPCHQSCFYRLALVAEEPFDTTWRVRADYEQFLRLKYERHAVIVYLKMTVADYEGGGFSETPENEARSERERKQIIAKYLPRDKVARYDLYRMATLQPLRKRLASHPKTASIYQRIKRRLYRGGGGDT